MVMTCLPAYYFWKFLMKNMVPTNVTGFWKMNQNVTLGQLHFLGPANSHTHTLPMHCCNTRLS